MRYVDLFHGAGGASAGAAQAGWECIGAVDNCAPARRIYAANFPTHACHDLDLAEDLPEELADAWRAALVDGAVVGGPPCQDYSSARRTAPRDRAALTVAFVRHAVRLHPRWIVLENVVRAQRSDEFREACDYLRDNGYHVRTRLVDARTAGLPQRRTRVVLTAARSEAALDAAHAHMDTLFDAPPTTIRECFATAGLECTADHVFFPACNQRARQSVFSVDGPAPTIRTIVRPLRARYPFVPKDSTSDRARVMPTLTARHHAAIQGFPATYAWVGTLTDCARGIGNAVPPPVMRRVATALTACTPDPPGSS